MFGKQKTAAVQAYQSDVPMSAMRAQGQEDLPLDAAIAGKEVFRRLVAAMTKEQGVHIESMLCVLGALAGYACQAQVRATARAQDLLDDAVFAIVTAVNGQRYYFGELSDRALLEGPASLWGMTVAALAQAGASALPDPKELVRHTTASVGTDAFGIPRVPERHKAGDKPARYLQFMWPTLFPVVRNFCPDPALWPVAFAVAFQHTIEAAKDAIDPGMAFLILMESAVPMSKVDLGERAGRRP